MVKKMGILGSYQATAYDDADDVASGRCASCKAQTNSGPICEECDQPLYGPIKLIGSRTLELSTANKCSS
jgi:hypothetical protein